MLGPCGPVDVVEMLGPCGPLVCWCGYPCRRRNRIRPTGRHHRWRMCHRGTCIRYGHSGPGARLGGVCRCAPGFSRPGFRPGLWSTGPTARPGTCIRVSSGTRPNSPASADACRRPILPADGCRDRRRRRRAFRASYRPRPASWDPSASRHRVSSVPSVPWAAWDLWDPSAA